MGSGGFEFPTGIGPPPHVAVVDLDPKLARASSSALADDRPHTTRRGRKLPATPAYQLGAVLAQPLVAMALGLVAGVGLLVASRLSFKVMRPEAPEVGLALSALLLLTRMGLVAGILLGYRAVAGTGFVPFAITMAGGFLIAYTIELLRYGKLLGTGSVLRARSTR